MNRARFALAATLVGASLVSTALAAQSASAPPTTSVLAGRKFTPPFKGVAEVLYTKPVTKREKDIVVTTFQVKNLSPAPLARFTVDESWYDEKGNVITGGKGVIGLLPPGEIQTMRIETGWNPKMKQNMWNFSHVNGTVKPKKVDKLGDDKQPATKNASATKKK
jgi:hypothetical protein